MFSKGNKFYGNFKLGFILILLSYLTVYLTIVIINKTVRDEGQK